MELRRAIHRSRTPEPYRASVWDESGVFCVDKRLWKNGNHFSTAIFLWLILMVSFQPLCHLERRNAPVWGIKTLDSNETQSREISCHHGLATFRSEISPLRYGRNDGAGRYHLFLHSPFVFRADGETVPFFIGLYQQRGEKAGPKSFLCRSAQSMEAERGGQKPS